MHRITSNTKRSQLLAVALGVTVLMLIAGCQSSDETEGILSRMAPCPDSPNCVSTHAKGEDHDIEPITYSGSAEDAKATLVAIVQDMPRTEIVEDDAGYIHAEFTSRIFRFVDDVEFQIDGDEGVIHFRSASRAGQSDMGVNRKRMESIREAFNAVK